METTIKPSILLLEKYIRKKTSNEGTIKQYLCQTNKFLKERSPEFNNDKELYEAIDSFVKSKPRCRNRRFALRHLFEFNKKSEIYERFIEKNKYQLRRLPRKKLKKSIPFQSIKLLVKNLKVPYNLITMLQYDGGLRIGAVLGLKVEDIGDRYESIIVKEKGDVIRTIYLSSMTKTMLKRVVSHGKQRKGRMFKVKYYDIWETVKKEAETLLGIDLSSHWFRSSRAIHLLESGESIITVKNLLGHKSLDTTYIYVQEAGVSSKALMQKHEPKW